MKKIILIGNPNTGKTTLFNNISNSNEHIGNWHGVTVECKEKKLKTADGKEFVLVDVPGTYSLSAYSFEEAVTRDYCIANPNQVYINICDANNLERNLYLTLELLEFGIKPILCINMANELKKSGRDIDTKKLSQMLGIKVILLNAQKKDQAKQIVNLALNQRQKNMLKLPYVQTFENIVDKFLKQDLIDDKFTTFEKLKLCELDDYVITKSQFSKEQEMQIKAQFDNQNTMQKLIEERYKFIEEIIKSCVTTKDKSRVYGYSKLDKIFLNKYFALPIFFVFLFGIFAVAFGQFGNQISNLIYNLFDKKIFGIFKNLIIAKTDNLFVQNFLCQAVFGTLSSLFSFLPQIVLMFLGLYILEDTGYLSRLAFVFDDIFGLVGLNGKSTFTLLIGFGCGTTASLTARDMQDKNSKIKTAMLTPYISCTAKLPLYTLICSAFFPKTKFFVVASIYILGVLTALFVSYFLNKTILPSREQNFIMEFPPYRLPDIKKLLKKIYQNAKEFILRVGTILLGFSCIVWILQNCNFKFQYAKNDSILMTISNFVAPIFAPLGFGNAGAVACLFCGFVAKEIIVSTIGIVNNVTANKNFASIAQSLTISTSIFALTKSSAISFLIFATLYLPCISTVSVFIKEIGEKWTIFACVLEFLISYIISFIVYKISAYFYIKGFASAFVSLITFLIAVFMILLSVRLIKQKKYCKFCPKHNFCDKK